MEIIAGKIKEAIPVQRSEQQLAEQKDKYFAISGNVSDIIISRITNFTIVSWNKTAEEVYGYSAEEMVGYKIPEILHFDFLGITRNGFFDLLDEKGIWKGEVQTTNRFGRQITALTTITKVFNEQGK